MFIIVRRPTTQTIDYSSTLARFYGLYGYIDSFFYYRNQKAYLSKLGPTFLDDKDNWLFINKQFVALYPYRSNDENPSAQFFYDSGDLYQDDDLYYIPFNFFTNDAVYASNCANTRTALNTYVQLFSIGNEVISYTRDSITPDPYASPSPVIVSAFGSGKNIVKTAPDGIPYPGGTSPGRYLLFSWQLDSSPSMDISAFSKLIVFPLGRLDYIDVSYAGQTDPSFNSDYRLTFPINGNYQFISLNLPKQYQPFKNSPVTIQTSPNSVPLQLVLTAKNPIVGNDAAYGYGPTAQKFAYLKLPKELLQPGLPVRQLDKSVLITDNDEYFYYYTSSYVGSQVYFNYSAIDSDTELFTGYLSNVNSVQQFDQTGPLSLGSNYVLGNGQVWYIFKKNPSFSIGFEIPAPKIWFGVLSSEASVLYKYDKSIDAGGIENTIFSNFLSSLATPTELYLDMSPYFFTDSFIITEIYNFNKITGYNNTSVSKALTPTSSVYNEINNAVLDLYNLPYNNSAVTMIADVPFDKVVRNFKGTIDLYPYYRMNHVNMIMLQLPEITNFNQFVQFGSNNYTTFSIDGINPYNFSWIPYNQYTQVAAVMMLPNGSYTTENSFYLFTDATKSYWQNTYYPIYIQTSNGDSISRYQKLTQTYQFTINIVGSFVREQALRLWLLFR